MKSNISILLKAVLFISFAFACVQAWGQAKNVTGTVYEPDGKTPLAGVMVRVGDTNTVVITDAGGKFSIGVPNNEAALSFTLMGFETQNVKVGQQSVLNVTMEDTASQISEVVVTALGITREERSLGYAVTKVGEDVVNSTVSGNWLNSLSGKVAGLTMDGASSGPSGSMRVTLRGEGSLKHDANEALFVIDGIPVGNPKISSGGSSFSDLEAPVDFGNNIGDLNPEDIESISVLKGPAATALYGSRAGNGAIVITTKSGRQTKGLGITLNSSVVFEQAGFWPDLQYEYGAGNGSKTTEDGLQQFYYSFKNLPNTNQTSDGGTTIGRKQSRYAWGPRYEGQMFYQYNGYNWETGLWKATPWQAKDWYTGFFNTGLTFSNSISIDGSAGKGSSFRLSVKDMRNTWIIPNTGYDSQTVSFSFSNAASKWVRVTAKATYLRKNSNNTPPSGYSQASPLYAIIYNVVSEDISSYKSEYFDGRIQWAHKGIAADPTNSSNVANYGELLINNASGARSENAFWLAYDNTNSLDRDRVYGNVQAEADITKWLKLQLRTGIDFSNDFRTQRKPQYSYGHASGWYREQTNTFYEMNNDFLFSYADRFEKLGLSINASFGGNNMVANNRFQRITATELLEPNIFMITNSRSTVLVDPPRTNKSVNSLYGLVSLGWRDMVYIDVTGRNDWSSTLASENWSFFYPSVSAGILLDEIFQLRSKARWINMLKIRASWANVGNDTDPYGINASYDNSTFTGGYKLAGQTPDHNILPENVESVEFGLETKLFQNRISFDLAWYHSKTTNQSIPFQTGWLTGAEYQLVNAGRVDNKGVEISARFVPIQTTNTSWTISLAWSKNWNKLVSLTSKSNLWHLNSANTVSNSIFIYAHVGEELGRIYGFGYERAPQGAYYLDANGNMIDCSGQDIVDVASGQPSVDTENLRDLGSIFPDWSGSISTSFSWKDLSVSATFTGQMGGKAYSVTNQSLSLQGKVKSTLEGRYDGLLHPGVNRNEDGTYSKNTTITPNIVGYYTDAVWLNRNTENNIHDTSFLKFKELRIDYSLPARWMAKTKVFQSISAGFFVTNIFCWTNFPQYDPEVASINNGSISRGIESGAYPMTRTYGMNLKLTF